MSNVEVTENGTAPLIHKPHHNNASLPYQSVGDFLSNTNNFKIIESTLREGEQFANAYFDTGMSAPIFMYKLEELFTDMPNRDQDQDVRRT
jgi:hypothetical protein